MAVILAVIIVVISSVSLIFRRRSGEFACPNLLARRRFPGWSLTRVVEVLGSEQHVYFSVDPAPVGGGGEPAQEGILAASVPDGVARLEPRAAVGADTRVAFAVDAARLHFFDPDSGNAIG
jgi:hypothetical protein